MKYTVEHYNNHGHMETSSDLSRADLREELARYVSDVPAIIAELKGAIESALLRDDIADDEIGDILRAALARTESLQSFTI